MDRRDAAGRSVRGPSMSEQRRILGRRRADSRRRDWCQHRHVQPRRRHPPQAAADRGSTAARAGQSSRARRAGTGHLVSDLPVPARQPIVVLRSGRNRPRLALECDLCRHRRTGTRRGRARHGQLLLCARPAAFAREAADTRRQPRLRRRRTERRGRRDQQRLLDTPFRAQPGGRRFVLLRWRRERHRRRHRTFLFLRARGWRPGGHVAAHGPAAAPAARSELAREPGQQLDASDRSFEAGHLS